MNERHIVPVEYREYYWEDKKIQMCPLMSKEELDLFPTRYLLSVKPRNLMGLQENSYTFFVTPNSVPKNCGFTRGIYGVKVKDFIDVLANRPHIPNKREAKALRKERIKRGK